MREHPSAEQLELYVIDMLSEGESRTVELHVADCAACAVALAHEARIEGAFDLLAQRVETSQAEAREAGETAQQANAAPAHAEARMPALFSRSPRSPRASWRLAGGIGGALAMAACALLWLGPAKADDRSQDSHLSASRDAEGHSPVAPAANDHLDGG